MTWGWSARPWSRRSKTAPKLLFNTIRRPLQTAAAAGELAASVYRTMRPVTETGSPLMKERTLVRKLGVHEVPLSKLREAAHRSGGSLNDAFVAGVAGGLRRYHEKHGVPIGELHLTMPISLRKDDDGMGGNRIGLLRFDIPAGVADPGASGSARSASARRRCATRSRCPTPS